MTIASSGEISLGGTTAGRSVNLTLGKSATATISMNDSDVRSLAGFATGAVSFSNFYGKSLNYSIVPNVTSVDEGGSVTFTVTTVGIANGATLFWTTNGNVNTSDFSDSVVSNSFTINNNTATITRTLTSDVTTEGAESFQLQVRTGSTSGTVVATSSIVTINDTSVNATYAITPSVTSVNEGGSVTFTVTTTSVANGTTLFWTTNVVSGTVNISDFTDNLLSGSFTINSNTGSIIRTLRIDATTEGAESFQLRVHIGSTSGTVVATSSTVTINDTSLTPTYSITPNVSSVNEGSSVTFTINTTNVPNGTILYWSTIGTISSLDFTDSTLTGTVTINSNTGSIVRSILNDNFTEGTESFSIRIRTDSPSGTIVGTSSTVTINDTSRSPPQQIVFTSSGSWVVPTGVTSISVAMVGGGGGGRYGTTNQRGGGGGSLSYRNNFTVTPGETLTVTVGGGGAAVLNNVGAAGGQSRLNRGATIICQANGAAAGGGGASGFTGITGVISSNGGPGGATGTGGSGGGGAGGYTGTGLGGAGAAPGSATSGAGARGAGGGGGSTTNTAGIGGKGGGVGLSGEGTSGTGVARVTTTFATDGNNGSGGSFGAGGAGGATTSLNAGRMNGNAGGVRIIWPGSSRQYPSTGTADV